jgi:acyl-CoA oxidase
VTATSNRPAGPTGPTGPAGLAAAFDGALRDPLRTDAGLRVLRTLAAEPAEPADPAEPSVAGAGDNHRTYRRLRALAAVLPPVPDLLRDPQWLAALSAGTAVADPALYMTVVNHYILCLGSVHLPGPDGPDRPDRADRPDRPDRAVTDRRPEQAPSDQAPGEHAASEHAPSDQVAALEAARRKGCYLVTEIGDAGSHLAARTTAEFDPRTREFVLDTPGPGAAKFSGVGAPGIPQTAVVCARLTVGGADRGTFPFLVDLCDEHTTAPGVTVSRALGVRTLPLEYALVSFECARIPYGQWLRGGAGIAADGTFHDPLGSPDRRLRHTLDVGRLLWATLPSAAAATARTAAAATLRHSRRRRSHGRLAPGAPVLVHSTQQRAVLGAMAEAFALTCVAGAALDTWARTGRRRPDSGGGGTRMDFAPWAAVDHELAAMKALAADGAARVAAECRQRCGLAGHLDVNRLTGYHGLADAFRTAGGDNRLILLDLGCALAGGEGPATATASGTRRAFDPDEPAWWPATIGELELRLTDSLRAAVREGRRQGLEGLDLWNPLLERARRLGEVHALRLAAQCVADTVAARREPGPGPEHDPGPGGGAAAQTALTALTALAALYGTAQALRLAGPLQWTGVLTAHEAQALEAVADRQSAHLMPYADDLAAAMTVPGGLLPTPLGSPDYPTALTETVGRPLGGRP